MDILTAKLNQRRRQSQRGPFLRKGCSVQRGNRVNARSRAPSMNRGVRLYPEIYFISDNAHTYRTVNSLRCNGMKTASAFLFATFGLLPLTTTLAAALPPPPPPPVKGAPSPLIGAGLPELAIGCAAYWVVKRRRRKN
jgi:hypothetical protein